MKKISYLFIAIAILLSDVMCAVVAFNYRGILCGIEHVGLVLLPAQHSFLPFPLALELSCVHLLLTHSKKSHNKQTLQS